MLAQEGFQADRLPLTETTGNTARFIEWAQRNHDPDRALKFTPRTPAVYSSAEFGVEGVGFNGGLGVLSGDHLLSMDRQEVPFIGLGLKYKTRNKQEIGRNGNGFWQVDTQVSLPTPEELGMTPVDNVKVVLNGAWGPSYEIPVYKYPLSSPNTHLFLLEAPGQVYPGETCDDARLWNDVILGFGGYEVLRQLREQQVIDEPAVYHLNESATVLTALAALDDLTIRYNGDYQRAKKEIMDKIAGSNHSVVPAVESEFTREQCEAFIFSNLKSETVKNELERFMWERGGKLALLDLMLYLSGRINGVSEFHAQVATGSFRQKFGELYYGKRVELKPVTNGVDRRWNKPMVNLFNRYGVLDQFDMPIDDQAELKRRIMQIPTAEIQQINALAAKNFRDYLASGEVIDQFGNKIDNLPEDAVIIGDARRMASYKQRAMMFRKPDVLEQFLDDHPRAHIFISGKAHPNDNYGKAMLELVLKNIASRDIFRQRIHFLPDWGLEVSGKLIPACDVWLSNPRVGEEACQTSGMKVALRGGILVSTPDGWYPQLKNGTYLKIVGNSESTEETDSYYENLNHTAAIAEDPQAAVAYARELWAGGALQIACAPRMLNDYFHFFEEQPLSQAA